MAAASGVCSSEPLVIPEGSTLTFTLRHEMRHSSRNIGRFRLSATSSSDPEFIVQVPAQLRPLLGHTDARRSKLPRSPQLTAKLRLHSMQRGRRSRQ